jgi:hypothetical protein
MRDDTHTSGRLLITDENEYALRVRQKTIQYMEGQKYGKNGTTDRTRWLSSHDDGDDVGGGKW